MRRSLRNTTITFLTALAVLPAAWAAGIDDYKLTKAIPADAFMSMHTRSHAGQAWVNKQCERVWKKVEEQKFDRDLKRIAKEGAKESGMTPEQFDEWWTKIIDLSAGVEWSTLGEREYAFCMKITDLTPEFVSLMMPPADKIEKDFTGLTGIAKTLSGLNPEMIVLATEGTGDSVIHKISFPGVPKEFSFGVTLARQKEVILIGFGSTLVEQSLALLQGKPGKTLASNPRFQEAFKKLSAPTDQAAFCDNALLMTQVRGLLTSVFKMVETQGNPAKEGTPEYEKAQAAKKLVIKIIDTFDIFDYSADVVSTDGMKSTGQSVTTFKADAKDKAFYKMLTSNGTIKDPLKYVPKTASDFTITSGFDVGALWAWVTKFIKEDVPESDEFFKGLAQMKEETGFDIEADLISWIQGGFAMVSVPGPSPYASGEFAFMLKVRDDAKAEAAINKLIDIVKQNLPEDQGRIEDSELPGFKVARIQALGMMPGLPSKPTIGVKDGWLMLASSPEFVSTVLDTAAGKSENFTKNERYAKECLQPTGNVVGLSFTDQAQMGEQLSMVFGSVGMVSMMAPPEVQKNPFFQSAMGVSGKLAKVVRELNFFQSQSTMTTLDGNAMTTKSLTTYKEPPADKPKAGSAEEKPNQ